MKNLLNSPDFHIHFVGIGGISMSGLAKILLEMGFLVTGSDILSSETTEYLKTLGIEVKIGHDLVNVEKANLVVRTNAVPMTDPEILRASELGTLVLERAELLGILSRRFKKTIAVSGCHGKSTTTAMIAEILEQASFAPIIHIGAFDTKLNLTAKFSPTEYFVTEACEYRRSFLSISPYISVILNVDYDHADYYKSQEDLLTAYDDFAKKASGFVLTTHEIKKKLSRGDNVITCGITAKNYYRAEKINNINGGYSFSFMRGSECLGRISLSVLGLHNLFNALFAATTCDLLGVPFEQIDIALSSYGGIRRRMEVLKKTEKLTIFSDYAHHPTEIVKLIDTLKPLGKKITIIFQPHTYSRTKSLFADFLTAFDGVDRLIIFSTYPARESFDFFGSAERLANNLFVPYVDSEEELVEMLLSTKFENDILVFLGAGDIDTIGRDIVRNFDLE